jgi:orotate phosphoribosyltransferase
MENLIEAPAPLTLDDIRAMRKLLEAARIDAPMLPPPEPRYSQWILPESQVVTEVKVDPPEPRYSHCRHLTEALPRRVADETIDTLKMMLTGVDFDTIAYRGISGTVMGPVLAYLLKKEQILVRKDHGKRCASGLWVEGFRHASKIVVLDDLIGSGSSVIDTILASWALTNHRAEVVKIVMYHNPLQMFGPGEICARSGYRFESLIERAEEKWKNGEHRQWPY